MTAFLKKYCSSWFVLFCLAAIAAILVCNLWSLFVGACVIHDYLRIPAIGWVLILTNVIAGLVLYLVKHRNKSKPQGSYCAVCHVNLRENWEYCPNCGDKVVNELHSTLSL